MYTNTCTMCAKITPYSEKLLMKFYAKIYMKTVIKAVLNKYL